jgi:hypothetical protein
VLQLRPPPGSGDIGHTERGETVLRTAVDAGRQVAWDVLATA